MYLITNRKPILPQNYSKFPKRQFFIPFFTYTRPYRISRINSESAGVLTARIRREAPAARIMPRDNDGGSSIHAVARASASIADGATTVALNTKVSAGARVTGIPVTGLIVCEVLPRSVIR